MGFSVARWRLVVALAVAMLLGALFVVQLASGRSPSRLPSSVTLRPKIPASKPSRQRGSTLGWASSNWSGYAVTPARHTSYTDVTGNWDVPKVTGCGGNGSGCYSAAWTGIDGFNDSSLIQTGTEQDYSNGTSTYSAWWTTSAFGFGEQVIRGGCSSGNNCGTVDSGDAMTAHIAEVSGSEWTITLSDKTKGWTFTTPTTYTGPGKSAEWIMEAPSVGGRIATLSTYDPFFTFDPGTVNGGSPGLVGSNGGELVQNQTVVSIPSPPDIDKDGFEMAYGSTPPSAPNS